MWVSKPIYESIPYLYLLMGALALGASMYLNYWHWQEICFVIGLDCPLAGLVVMLNRRDHRFNDRRLGQRQDY